MPIIFRCACGREMRAKAELAGKRTKCPNCQAIVVIPNPEAELAAAKAAKAAPSSKPVSLLDDVPIALVPDDPPSTQNLPRIPPLGEPAPSTPPPLRAPADLPSVQAEPLPLPEGCRQYKVLTPKDMGFIAKFDAERLEVRLNELAREGWCVRSTVSMKLPGPTGVHDELIMILEK